MQLRHIRPRSVDWYDATLEDGARGVERLSPEEKTKLRRMGDNEVDLPPLQHAAQVQHGAGRTLL
jgi:hypothetical protein